MLVAAGVRPPGGAEALARYGVSSSSSGSSSIFQRWTGEIRRYSKQRYGACGVKKSNMFDQVVLTLQ